MYNYQKIRNMSDKDMIFLIKKAEIMSGSEGRKLRRHIAWLLSEVI